jgi:hypothetical protein
MMISVLVAARKFIREKLYVGVLADFLPYHGG